jgi:hypothetical protein
MVARRLTVQGITSRPERCARLIIFRVVNAG